MLGDPPAVASKSSTIDDDGFVMPVKLMVGAELRFAVTVAPEKVIFHVAMAAAASVLRWVLWGVGAPDVTAAIVADTPVGHAAPVTSENVPATPFDVGTAALVVLLGATAADAIGVEVASACVGLAGTDEPPPPPPQPATSPARTIRQPALDKKRARITRGPSWKNVA
jgi:hypothetical protein